MANDRSLVIMEPASDSFTSKDLNSNQEKVYVGLLLVRVLLSWLFVGSSTNKLLI